MARVYALHVIPRPAPSLWPDGRWALLKGKVSNSRLVPFVCRQCVRLILQASPRAQAWCRECRRWVTVREAKALKSEAVRDGGR